MEMPANNQHQLIKRLFYGVFVLLLLTAIAAAGFFFLKFEQIKKNPNMVSEKQAKDLLDRVGELIILPANEQPTIATITNPEALKDKAFFANAKKGFKVIIYSQSKKAILYDPATNKIIEVAPVNFGSDLQGAATNQAQIQPSKK